MCTIAILNVGPQKARRAKIGRERIERYAAKRFAPSVAPLSANNITTTPWRVYVY